VAVDAEAGVRAVRRLGEKVAAKERVNPGRLALQRLGDRGVTGQRDTVAGAEVAKRFPGGLRQQPGAAGEGLDLRRLAELARAAVRKAAAEPLAASHAQPPAGQVKLHAAAVQHDHPGLPQEGGDLALAVALAVVVAGHRHHRYAETREFRGDDPGLGNRAVLGQVPRQQQNVPVPADISQVRPDPAAYVRGQADVPCRGYPDHDGIPRSRAASREGAASP
jgi:hypothetical protein